MLQRVDNLTHGVRFAQWEHPGEAEKQFYQFFYDIFSNLLRPGETSVFAAFACSKADNGTTVRCITDAYVCCWICFVSVTVDSCKGYNLCVPLRMNKNVLKLLIPREWAFLFMLQLGDLLYINVYFTNYTFATAHSCSQHIGWIELTRNSVFPECNISRVQYFQSAIFPECNIVDIGAHAGDSTLPLAVVSRH